MKSFFYNLFISPDATDYTGNTGYLYKRIVSWIIILTLLISILLLLLSCNRITAVATFLSVSGASIAGGAAIGFLFGLPRSEKYRFIKKEDADHSSREYSYSDNTNLEEVSDWLTKIIVGISLIKFRTIIGWIDMSAHSIDRTFMQCCANNVCPFNAYVFGYSVIILYFLAGSGLCYLWARTNLSLILTRSRISQRDLEKQQLISQVQMLANPDLNTATNFAVQSTMPGEIAALPTEPFRNLIESIYNAKPVIDKTDLQKGRWGKSNQVDGRQLEAEYDPSISFMGLYRVKLKVRSLSPEKPLIGQVAFFLHDSFPSEIVYAKAHNNVAEISFTAWEAFVAGARTEDGTELELDLNKVKGFPEGFYYKDGR